MAIKAQVHIRDAQGHKVTVDAILLGDARGVALEVESLADLTRQLSSSLPFPPTSAPTSSETAAKAATVGGEADPRTIKCPQCPHPASDHTDSGCTHLQTQEKEWRDRGVQGYCKCGITYASIMVMTRAALALFKE
jgi:hypothetical protein